MDRDFDLRRSVYDLPADQVRMIDIARRHGSHAKFAGSGGAAIGTCEDDAHLARITAAYAEGRHLPGAGARGQASNILRRPNKDEARCRRIPSPWKLSDGNRFLIWQELDPILDLPVRATNRSCRT